VVYKEVDHAGGVSVGIAIVGDYLARREALIRSNMRYAKAYTAARKAWNAAPEHEGVRFPLKRPAPAKCVEVKRFSEEEKARVCLAGLEARLARLRKKREAAQKRRAPVELSDAQREEAERRAALLKEAKGLFQTKLDALSGKVGGCN